jgi:hypothetical protein
MPTAPLLHSALAVGCLLGCSKHREPPAAPGPSQIGRTGAVTIDGKLDEPAWNASARVFTFTDHGTEARPFSQVRMLHDEHHLYVGLYAADQDIRSSDRFQLVVGDQTLSIDPHGQVAPVTSGVSAAVDLDGTIDDPSDEDEEWVIELVMPVPAPPFTIRASRCDTPKDGLERCGSWASPSPLTLAL